MAGDHPGLDFSRLPRDLRCLAPFIAKYRESDDVERSTVLANASLDELRELSTAADPHWGAITAFLDENMAEIGPRQDLALALDAFSQAAMEAKRKLDEGE